MDSPQPTTTTSPSPAEQARIRRERRQAKLKAEGTSRLNRITSTQSGSRLYEEAKTPAPAPAAAAVAASPAVAAAAAAPASETVPAASVSVKKPQAEDPAEVDISEHFYQPKPRTTAAKKVVPPGSPLAIDEDPFAEPGLSESQMRELMAQYAVVPGGNAGAPDTPEDPMLAMLQQMMGLPPMGAGGMPGMGMPQQQQQEQEQEKWAVWWSVLHTVCALVLAIWSLGGLGWLLPAGEAKVLEEQEEGMLPSMSFSSKVLYAFATMELLLQSSRFVIEKGRPPPGSILSSIGQILPPPFGGYLITVARYSVIWTTMMNDALLVAFVVGMWAWWTS